MRIRERLGNRLTKAYLDSMTLKQNALSLKDFKEIVIQPTLNDELLCEDDLLLAICQWFPRESKFGPITEVSIIYLISVIILVRIQ